MHGAELHSLILVWHVTPVWEGGHVQAKEAIPL